MSAPQSAPESTAALSDPRTSATDLLLAALSELVRKLHPRRAARIKLTLDCDLDSDLGLDSLGRARLLHRLEGVFAVHLRERLIAEASTPSDLLDGALAAAQGSSAAERKLEAGP